MAKKDNTVSPIGFNTQAKKDAEGKERPFILQQLTVRPLYRRSHDIASMLQAIRTAEAIIPRRTELYDLYADFLSSDAHLRTVCDKRIMGVTNVDWVYLDKDGQEVPFMTDWIDSPDFELTISEILNTKLWGYTMLEYEFYGDGTFGVYLVPRKHMRPQKGMISFEQTADSGINIREGVYANTILEAGDEKDLGLLMVAAQYVIFKRASLSDWAEFAEVFGQPLIDAVWDGFDETQRKLLLQAIDEMGAGGRIVRPAGTELTFQQGAGNNPNGQLFQGIIDVCNAEISKLFLGQTETTESSDSSGYAQASVHAGTENDINKMDIKYVRRILNRRLLKILEFNGIVAPGGSFSVKDIPIELPLTDRVNVDLRLRNEAKLPMTDDYFYEKYGVDKPENYGEIKKQQEAEAAAAAQQQSAGFQMALRQALIQLRDEGFFRKAPIATGANTKELLRNFYLSDQCCTNHKAHGFVKLSELTDAGDDFIKKVFNEELKDGQIHQDYYFAVAEKLTQAIKEGLNVGSLSVDDARAKILDKFKNNIYAFSAAKNLTMLQDYRNALTDDKGNKVSYSKFRDATQTDEEFNDNYLQTEYKSAQAVGQMANKWTKLQKYDMLMYRTVGDSKVRPKHAALDGLILESNDPLWRKIYPPNDWGCRCTVIPAQGQAQTGRDAAQQFSESPALKPYFKRNVGIEHVAFDEDEHPYFERIKQFKTGINKQVELLAEENYNLPSVEKAISKKNLPEFIQATTKEAAQDQWNRTARKIKTADGLDWDLSDRWDHVVGDHPDQDRWKYINHSLDVLKDADEVWITKEVMPNGSVATYKRYLKYFSGQPVVLSYNVDDPANWTMYKADPDASGTYSNIRNNVRRGILINRK